MQHCSSLKQFCIREGDLRRDVIILIMGNLGRATFRILPVGKIQVAAFIDMDRQNRQDKPLTKKLPEVYLWLYGGELAPVRLGVRPDYNIA